MKLKGTPPKKEKDENEKLIQECVIALTTVAQSYHERGLNDIEQILSVLQSFSATFVCSLFSPVILRKQVTFNHAVIFISSFFSNLVNLTVEMLNFKIENNDKLTKECKDAHENPRSG